MFLNNVGSSALMVVPKFVLVPVPLYEDEYEVKVGLVLSTSSKKGYARGTRTSKIDISKHWLEGCLDSRWWDLRPLVNFIYFIIRFFPNFTIFATGS